MDLSDQRCWEEIAETESDLRMWHASVAVFQGLLVHQRIYISRLRDSG